MKAQEERYELVTVLGYPALFTSMRIDRDSVPEGLHHYEIRHEDDNGMAAAQIGRGIMVNHMGTLLMRSELSMDAHGYLDIEDTDLVFTNSGIRELDEYMPRYPKPGRLLDAAKEEYEEVLLGSSKQEPVLHHWGVLDFQTVPESLRVLYAYEDESGYGIRLYEPGKTVVERPFLGTYLSVKSEDSLFFTTDGMAGIFHQEVFAGRESKMTMQAYLKERGLSDATKKRKKPEPER